MKKVFIILTSALLALGLATTAWSINFGNILKEIEKPPAKQPEPTPAPAPTPKAPAQQQGGGGLLGILEGTGVVNKKTSNIIKGAGQLVKSMEPIGYEEEKAIGGSLAIEVFNRFGGPYKNDQLQKYITLIGQSVVDVSNRADIPYHFAVLNTDQPNAFATPGGYIFVSKGLLKLVRNEAELAGILGHEVAHVSKRHALQTIERSKSMQGISNITTTLLNKDAGVLGKILNEMTDTLFTKGLDRNLEFEADKYGAEFAYRVGYYPGGLKDFMKVLGKNQSSGSVLLSTHPSPRERFSLLSKQMRRYADASLAPVLAKRYGTWTSGQLR